MKSSVKLFLLISVVAFFSNHSAFAQTPQDFPTIEAWPFGDPPETPGTLFSLPGDKNGAQFHAGIDIPRQKGDWIYAAFDGCVLRIDPESTRGAGLGRIIMGFGTSSSFGWKYLHVTSFQFQEGDCFSVGQEIAQVADFAPGDPIINSLDHLHFESSPKPTSTFDPARLHFHPFEFFAQNLPLPPHFAVLTEPSVQFISDQVAPAHGQADPRVLDSASYIQNGRVRLRGNIDILVEAHSNVAGDTRPGVHKLSWQVFSGPGLLSPVIAERLMVAFNSFVEDLSVLNLAYFPQQSGDPYYGLFNGQV